LSVDRAAGAFLVGLPTMKATLQDTYGSPDVLELRDIDMPVVADDPVLVRVHSAGVDQGACEWKS